MKKILIIEDEEIIRETTADMLRLARYDVHTAENGRLGVKLAQEILPDLVVCDIMMPEIDGYGVIHLLSRDPATSSIPFIFLSAKAEKSDIRRGMSLGADDYLTKPFEEMDLLNAIDGRLKRNDLLKQDFAHSREGLEHFMDTVQEVTALRGLYQDREPRHYKKKQTVYHEGDDPQFVYFLHTGKVRIYKIHPEGKEYTISLVDAGEFFGQLPIMEHREYSDFAETLEDSEICRIPRADFEELLRKDREVGNIFIKRMAKDYYEREKKLLSMAYDSVRKRTANALLELWAKYHKEEDADYRIDISRQDLGSMVGTAAESVIRVLAEFKSEGLISVDKSYKITILDERALRAIRS